MSTYGRATIGTVGNSIQLTADGQPEMKVGGVSIDWATVAAVSGSDVTLEDGVTVLIGEKYIRYGQVLCKITASGKYGPWDNATPATDGRQLLVRGNCFLANQTVKENDHASDHVPVLDGGRVFKDRILQTGAGAHTLAGGPTLAEFEAAFPRISYVGETPQ
jgi:hypothetical protein